VEGFRQPPADPGCSAGNEDGIARGFHD
jgi:hypothetical protein